MADAEFDEVLPRRPSAPEVMLMLLLPPETRPDPLLELPEMEVVPATVRAAPASRPTPFPALLSPASDSSPAPLFVRTSPCRSCTPSLDIDVPRSVRLPAESVK